MCKTDNIYVLLSDTGTIFTRLIKGFTGAPYNHASLVLDENLHEVFSFGRKKANNPLLAGFVREDMYEGTFRHFPHTRCALLRIAVSAEQRANLIQTIRDFEKNKHLYSYNLIGLFGVLLDMDLQPVHSYFCSQFVAETMTKSGIPLWERPSALVTPNDFLNHPLFQVLYEGPLYDYPLLNRQRLGNHAKTKWSLNQLLKRAM
ncbi:hypothetical protein A7975_06005 [Bacillus sp. FJAT-26390]|nr:hypothetical protein A7975_06005 [Bacillus sp. FJAT-26390]